MALAAQQKKNKANRSADRRNVWLLVVTTLLVIGSVFLFTPPAERINQGLDIQGGLSVVLTAKGEDGASVSAEDMEKSRAIIESRVNALGASEAVVQVQGTNQTRYLRVCRFLACPTRKRRSTPSARRASWNSRGWTRFPTRT